MKKKVIAIYVRESTREQVENGFNLETQIKKAKDYIKLYDVEGEIRVYSDGGYSAKTTNRPSLNKLREDVKSGLVSHVVVYKIDRLVRRLLGLNELIMFFKKYNTSLMSVSEKVDFDSANGRFLINILVMLAEWEQDTISERTNDGLLEGAEQGYYMIGGKRPFGYERINMGNHKQLKVNEEEKRVLKEMKIMLKKGYSMYAIQMVVNSDSYMQSINKTYCENQLYRCLKNPILKGVMHFKNKDYKLDIDTIFTNEEFEELQVLIKERQKNSKYKYLFCNKVRNKTGKLSSIKSTVKKNGVYLYYYDSETKKRLNETNVKECVLKYFANTNKLYKSIRCRTYGSDLKYMEEKRKKIEFMYNNCEITTKIYMEEVLKNEKEMRVIEECYIKYIKNIDIYFDNLDFDEKNRVIYNNVKYIEVDFENKEVINVC